MHKPNIEEIARMITPEELSKLISVPVKTLNKWRIRWDINKLGPRPTKLGPSDQSPVRYRMMDVLDWQNSLERDDSAAERIEAEYERQRAS